MEANTGAPAPPSVYRYDFMDNDFVRILLMGDPTSGKTRLWATAPKPILCDLFDPAGHIVIRRVFEEELRRGDIQIRFWDHDDPLHPYQFNRFAQQFEKDIAENYLSRFGTYVQDSLTTMLKFASYKQLHDRNAVRPSGKHLDGLALDDYKGLYRMIERILFAVQTQKCNYILTAHLETVQDEHTGILAKQLAVPRSLKADIPPLFTEKWVMMKEPTAAGVQYHVLTNSEGLYKDVGTQIGADLFARREKPDISELLQRAGLSVQPKRRFWEDADTPTTPATT